MKKFNLEAAKAGAKVQTKDGRAVRLVCFDMKGDQPLVGLVSSEEGDYENEECFSSNGKYYTNTWGGNLDEITDLYMSPTKIKYYVHVYKQDGVMYSGHPNTLNWKQWSEGCDYMDYIQTFEFEVEE
jgi:hypothetical protein